MRSDRQCGKSACACRIAASPRRSEAEQWSAVRFPAIVVRPSFTMGGTGGNIAYNIEGSGRRWNGVWP